MPDPSSLSITPNIGWLDDDGPQDCGGEPGGVAKDPVVDRHERDPLEDRLGAASRSG